MGSLFDHATPHAGGYRDIPVTTVAEAREGALLVDVREPHEYTGELGHIQGAELVPLATVGAAAAGWDKDREIVLVCRSGNRSGKAAAQLAASGFTRAMNMVGGMLAWNEARLPVER
jgi:rhodanese-related sulfurtransferase